MAEMTINEGRSPAAAERARVLALFGADQHAEAVALITDFTTRFPADAWSWRALAWAHRQLRQPAEVEAALRHAIALTPGDVESLVSLGDCLEAMGRIEAAADTYHRAVRLKPNSEIAWFNLANVLARLDRLDEAEEGYRKALRIKPDYRKAHHNLSILLHSRQGVDGSHPAGATTLATTPALPVAAAAAHSSLEAATALFHRGEYARAWTLLDPLLTAAPQDDAVLDAAAHCALRLGQPAQAEALWARAAALRPGDPQLQVNLGNVRADLERHGEAIDCYRQALAVAPDYPEAHNNLGLACEATGRRGEAEVCYRQALRLKPQYANAHYNLAGLLHGSGRLDEAEFAYKRTLAERPEFAAAHHDFGNLLRKRNQLADAAAAYQLAAIHAPQFAAAFANLGAVLLELERADDAEIAMHRASELQPGDALALYALGEAQQRARRWREAEANFRKALAASPRLLAAHNALGNLLKAQLRFVEAGHCYEQATAIDPRCVEAWTNIGVLHLDRQRYADAEQMYRKALSIKPDDGAARYNLACLQLMQGQYEAGWRGHELRLEDNPAAEMRTTIALPAWVVCPRWQGEDLAGKRLLVWPEQGFGDEIQFVRYLARLAALAPSRLTLVCKAALKALFAANITCATAVLTPEEAESAGAHDYWVPLMSLPLRFGTTLDTIPAELPYLHADPARVAHWAPQMPAAGCKVGLVWQGNPRHSNDARRSLPGLASLAPLWTVGGVSFISLQKGPGEDEAAAPPPAQPLHNLGALAGDFADTAAIVSLLDLVICVDTAVAHVAGALGKPCWVLVPCVGTDWRWLIEREDTPWYPRTLRLFRQREPASWAATIEAVAGELHQLAAPGSGAA